MHKIDLQTAPSGSGSSYPSPFDEPCRGRSWHRLGVAAGLAAVYGIGTLKRNAADAACARCDHHPADRLIAVACTKQGFLEATGNLASEFQAMTFGNILFGGIVGSRVKPRPTCAPEHRRLGALPRLRAHADPRKRPQPAGAV